MNEQKTPEEQRLMKQKEDKLPTAAWGPYLSERQWGTVREDYSKDGNAWDYFPHEHARSRAYRWGEDGIAGISDAQCQLCFAPYVSAAHPFIGKYYLYFDQSEQFLFTENETNKEKVSGSANETPFVKDAFHSAIINNDFAIFNGKNSGTKFSPVYKMNVEPGSTVRLHLRISRKENLQNPFGQDYETAFINAKKEADEFYQNILPSGLSQQEFLIVRQAFAGMLWNKQFYYYDVREWLQGDKGQPPPPEERLTGRNSKWKHLNNRDIISVPDKWEFPWYASWDLAFHTIIFGYIDPEFAKHQQILINREWYTHPNGQIPAYEWSFGDVNPPVQAWAAMRVYEIEKKKRGVGDIAFLKRIFQKLTINFTWWANQKDIEENYVFEGGFLGLDNIGVLDRNSITQKGHILEQADGTAWMGMFATYMLEMAIEIAQYDETFEDVALKYFEQYTLIAESLNTNGLWDEEQNFFFDVLKYPDGKRVPLKVRSIIGLTSIFATLYLPENKINKLKHFKHGINWFRKYGKERDLYLSVIQKYEDEDSDRLISLIRIEKLQKLLAVLLDEEEFLSPYGIRSVSKKHSRAYTIKIDKQLYSLQYDPGESTTRIFGSNSNWRGPIWFPINYLIIQSLKAYYQFFGDELKAEFPSRSGNYLNLEQVALRISARLQKIFVDDQEAARPLYGRFKEFYMREENRNLILFHEYFHGETGAGLGASHQTGWTGLIAALIQEKNTSSPPPLR